MFGVPPEKTQNWLYCEDTAGRKLARRWANVNCWNWPDKFAGWACGWVTPLWLWVCWLWYCSLSLDSSSINDLFCASSIWTLFSRHLMYSFFFLLHSRAATLFLWSLLALFFATSSAKSPGLIVSDPKSELRLLSMWPMEPDDPCGELDIWSPYETHESCCWKYGSGYSSLGALPKDIC